MLIPKDIINSNLVQISNLLDVMELDKLYIYSIILDEQFEYEVTEVEQVKYIEVGFKFFMENLLENPENVNFWEHNNDTLYILRDGNYNDISEIFANIQEHKFHMAKGSSQKAHMVSPMDFRLSCYLLILCNMSYKKFYSENSFKTISKEKYILSLSL